MGRTITIFEEGGSVLQPSAPPAPESRFDVQDGLIAAGFVAIEVGIGLWSIAAALIVAGLLFFAAAYLIEKSKVTGEKKKRGPVSA